MIWVILFALLGGIACYKFQTKVIPAAIIMCSVYGGVAGIFPALITSQFFPQHMELVVSHKLSDLKDDQGMSRLATLYLVDGRKIDNAELRIYRLGFVDTRHYLWAIPVLQDDYQIHIP